MSRFTPPAILVGLLRVPRLVQTWCEMRRKAVLRCASPAARCTLVASIRLFLLAIWIRFLKVVGTLRCIKGKSYFNGVAIGT